MNIAPSTTQTHQPHTRSDWLILAGMFVGLAVFYRASYQLPISAVGFAFFALLALVRPDVALLFVPLTVPLFFMPKGIWDERFGIRSEGVRFPLHEVVLLVTCAAVALQYIRQFIVQHLPMRDALNRLSALLKANAVPLLLLLLFAMVGSVSVAVAQPAWRGDALREWRWLIIEPLMFYCVVRWYLHLPTQPDAYLHPITTIAPHRIVTLLAAFVIGGGYVGIIGVLQYWGINLAPYIGDEVGFSTDMMYVEGVFRVNSVYGHPNNLALFMGRVWAPAAMLALVAAARKPSQRVVAWFFAACLLAILGGLYVAFSKGAQLAAFAAILIMAGVQLMWEVRSYRLHPAQSLRRMLPTLLLLLLFTAMMASGMGVERLNLFGASSEVRMKTWQSAMQMIREHPVTGIGLDQFSHMYTQYMHPSLRDTTEQYISHPHMMVLDVWLRMGIAGVVMFAFIIARFYWRMWRVIRLPSAKHTLHAPHTIGAHRLLATGVVAAMSAALVHGMVDNSYFVVDLAYTFWLFVAIADGRELVLT